MSALWFGFILYCDFHGAGNNRPEYAYDSSILYW